MERSHRSSLHDPRLPTPCLVVDRTKVEANAARMRDRFAGKSIRIRPHLKTVKSYELALLAMHGPSGPATVSTLKEAEEFGKRGVTDILYAVTLAPQKLGRVSDLRQSGLDLKVVVDSDAMARAVGEHARAAGEPVPTLIEIDVDGHRSGVPVHEHPELIRIGKALHDHGCLHGVMCHAGGSYDTSGAAALAMAAEGERSGIVHAAETLRSAGLPCEVVSMGSTPTALHVRSVDGITEVRAGVYLFFDLFQAGLGVCSINDIALSVLATVIGHQKRKGWTLIDAGWMALSSDRGTASQAVDQFYGLVCDIEGNVLQDVVVQSVNQEHGIIAARPGSGASCPELPLGTRVRILPNHACATAAQHAEYTVVEGLDIAATWRRFQGW